MDPNRGYEDVEQIQYAHLDEGFEILQSSYMRYAKIRKLSRPEIPRVGVPYISGHHYVHWVKVGTNNASGG